MFRALTFLSLLSSCVVMAGGPDFDLDAHLRTEPVRSCLKKKESESKKSVEWSLPKKEVKESLAFAFEDDEESEGPDEDDEVPLFLGRFETQEKYDDHVGIDPVTGEKENAVLFEFQRDPLTGRTSCLMHTYKCEYVEQLPQFKMKRLQNEVLPDMEWQYAFHSLERFFGLSNEEFERNPLWKEEKNHYEAYSVLEAVSNFLGLLDESERQQLIIRLSVLRGRAESWYKDSPYSQSVANEELAQKFQGMNEGPFKKSRYKNARSHTLSDHTDSFMQNLTDDALQAEIALYEIVASDIFKCVKGILTRDLKSHLISGKPFSDILEVNDDIMRPHVRRFIIGIKQFLFFPISYEEEQFIKTYVLPTEKFHQAIDSSEYEEFTDSDIDE